MKAGIRIFLAALPVFVLTVGALPAAAEVESVEEGVSRPEQCLNNAQCDDGLFCNGTERCDPSDPGADKLGCLPATAGPCRADQDCIESEALCKDPCRFSVDGDGDGAMNIRCGGDDCDDRDGNRFPGNSEVCDDNGHDEDCDPTTFGSKDEDGDGHIDVTCWNPPFNEFGRVIPKLYAARTMIVRADATRGADQGMERHHD